MRCCLTHLDMMMVLLLLMMMMMVMVTTRALCDRHGMTMMHARAV